MSGSVFGDRCTGAQVKVNHDGMAKIFIKKNHKMPVLAIHIESQINTTEIRRESYLRT